MKLNVCKPILPNLKVAYLRTFLKVIKNFTFPKFGAKVGFLLKIYLAKKFANRFWEFFVVNFGLDLFPGSSLGIHKFALSLHRNFRIFVGAVINGVPGLHCPMLDAFPTGTLGTRKIILVIG